MKKWLNDPSVNRKYNYIYKIINKINNKIYIGIHRTDNLDDGYMGSGTLLKRSIKKHGIHNFEKTILQIFDTYQEAINKEKELVDIFFVQKDDNYNIYLGGYGGAFFDNERREKISQHKKDLWANDIKYKEKMLIMLKSEDRRKKISNAHKLWIKNNPEKHEARMMKINKNPLKIAKMAETHRGMKRSIETCKNVSESLKNLLKDNPDMLVKMCGKGCKYIHNIETRQIKRINYNDDIPEGWAKGTGSKIKKD